MIGHHAWVEWREQRQRLEELGASVDDRLSERQSEFLAELVTAGEYQLALEMIADWLAEDGRPITEAERAEARGLAEAFGNVDRVMGTFRLCPDA
jgi:hypothetical protein